MTTDQSTGNTKVFEVTHDWSGWNARLRIKQDLDTSTLMREMLLFWAGGPEWIAKANGDITQAWLMLFGRSAIWDSADWSLEGVKDSFINREGWVPLDGTYGIELLAIESFEFDSNDFSAGPVDQDDEEASA